MRYYVVAMDYLDPAKKRAHRKRLYLGYGLFAVAIFFATLLMVYIANGYYVDRSTGQVIQNGLVYVDSKPGGAKVTLNGEEQGGTTDVRLVIPSGKYAIGINKDGYRPWNHTLRLEGGSLRRITYPRLIPNELNTTNEVSWRANPIAMSQSIDKRWLVASYRSDPLELTIVDTESPTFSSVPFALPSSVVGEEKGVFEVVEWADDNTFFLGSFTTGKKVEYLLLDRRDPAATVNLSTELGDTKNVFEIGLRDRKNNDFFAFNTDQKTLYTASIDDGIRSEAVVQNVLSYKTFQTDWVLYVTPSTSDKDMVEVRLKRGNNNILLKNLKEDEKNEYLLQLARLGNAPIIGFAARSEGRITVYNDPEKYLNDNPEVSFPVATTVLRVADPIDLRISVDSSVILAYGPKNFASHEFEADRSYTFKVGVEIKGNQELRWMDGQHFLFSADGIQNVMDFTGSNRYELVASDANLGSFFSEDLNTMFTIQRGKAATNSAPQTPARLQSTSLLIPEDR